MTRRTTGRGRTRGGDTHAALVVVGAGPAGRAAAGAYREAGGEGRVLLIGAEGRLPYARPPLTKDHLRGESGPDGLLLAEASWYADHDIDLLLDRPVVRLDAAGREVELANGTTCAFASCVLATGSVAAPPPFPGAAEALSARDGSEARRRVHVVRSLDHATALRAAAGGGGTAVVVGSGFIGCEAAVSLARRGLQVTVVSPDDVPQQARLGRDVGRRIAGWLAEEGVRGAWGTEVLRLDPDGVVVTAGGRRASDVVLLATGHAPDAVLARDAGIATQQGRILTDAGMRSSVEGVFAAGDVALAVNTAAGRRLPVEHWGEALTMGGIAGANAAGADEAWANAPGFWSVLGDRTLKQVAWGDGFDAVRVDDHGGGAFTARYGRDGVTVGVLAHDRDEDYERGRELVESAAPLPG